MARVIKTVVLPDGALASRRNAIPYRQEILQVLSENSDGLVNIDLKGVKTISGSFADECIGVLVMQLGFENLIKRIKLINGSQNVVRSIADAINIRKLELATQGQSANTQEQFQRAFIQNAFFV